MLEVYLERILILVIILGLVNFILIWYDATSSNEMPCQVIYSDQIETYLECYDFPLSIGDTIKIKLSK